MKTIRLIVALPICFIGARLWELGGYWTCNHEYKNLTWFGKLGANMFWVGLKIYNSNI